MYARLKAGATGYLIKRRVLWTRLLPPLTDKLLQGGAPMSFGVAKRVLQYFREENQFQQPT